MTMRPEEKEDKSQNNIEQKHEGSFDHSFAQPAQDFDELNQQLGYLSDSSDEDECLSYDEFVKNLREGNPETLEQFEHVFCFTSEDYDYDISALYANQSNIKNVIEILKQDSDFKILCQILQKNIHSSLKESQDYFQRHFNSEMERTPAKRSFDLLRSLPRRKLFDLAHGLDSASYGLERFNDRDHKNQVLMKCFMDIPKCFNKSDSASQNINGDIAELICKVMDTRIMIYQNDYTSSQNDYETFRLQRRINRKIPVRLRSHLAEYNIIIDKIKYRLECILSDESLLTEQLTDADRSLIKSTFTALDKTEKDELMSAGESKESERVNRLAKQLQALKEGAAAQRDKSDKASRGVLPHAGSTFFGTPEAPANPADDQESTACHACTIS